MTSKMFPYLFLGILTLVLTFVVGVRYGKNVEQTSKTISYLLSITPTKTLPSPTIQYLIYKLEACRVQFTYPSYLSKSSEKPRSLLLVDSQKQTALTLDCGPQLAIAEPENDKIATEEITFKNKKTMASKLDTRLLQFKAKHPQKGTITTITIDKNLYPLFESSLQFLP